MSVGIQLVREEDPDTPISVKDLFFVSFLSPVISREVHCVGKNIVLEYHLCPLAGPIADNSVGEPSELLVRLLGYFFSQLEELVDVSLVEVYLFLELLNLSLKLCKSCHA